MIVLAKYLLSGFFFFLLIGLHFPSHFDFKKEKKKKKIQAEI